jgi:hypothetical protein
LQVIQEQQAFKVFRVLQELQGQQDLLVLRAHKEFKDLLV